MWPAFALVLSLLTWYVLIVRVSVRASLAGGARSLGFATRQRHRGHSRDDANESDPRRRGEGLAKEHDADADSDGHSKVRLKRRAHRSTSG